MLELLRNGEAEIGVTTDAPSRRLRSWPLARDEYVLVRERSKGRRRLDTKGATLILWKERCSAVVPQIANDMNWRPKKIVEVDSDAAVLSMVENGAGVTVMPRLATEPLSAGLEAERLPVTVYRQITLCTTAGGRQLAGRKAADTRDSPLGAAEVPICDGHGGERAELRCDDKPLAQRRGEKSAKGCGLAGCHVSLRAR